MATPRPASGGITFTDLPPELRLLVYERLLPSMKTVGSLQEGDAIRTRYDERCDMAVMATNNQIHAETTDYVGRKHKLCSFAIDIDISTAPHSNLYLQTLDVDRLDALLFLADPLRHSRQFGMADGCAEPALTFAGDSEMSCSNPAAAVINTLRDTGPVEEYGTCSVYFSIMRRLVRVADILPPHMQSGKQELDSCILGISRAGVQRSIIALKVQHNLLVSIVQSRAAGNGVAEPAFDSDMLYRFSNFIPYRDLPAARMRIMHLILDLERRLGRMKEAWSAQQVVIRSAPSRKRLLGSHMPHYAEDWHRTLLVNNNRRNYV